MTDKLREEAHKLIDVLRLSGLPTSPADREMVFEELCKIYNSALEESARLMQDIVFVSGLSKDDARNSIERANAIRNLKVTP